MKEKRLRHWDEVVFGFSFTLYFAVLIAFSDHLV